MTTTRAAFAGIVIATVALLSACGSDDAPSQEPAATTAIDGSMITEDSMVDDEMMTEDTMIDEMTEDTMVDEMTEDTMIDEMTEDTMVDEMTDSTVAP